MGKQVSALRFTQIPQIREVKLMLTAARLREALDYDPATGRFRWKQCKARWMGSGLIAGCPHIAGYWMIGIDRKRYLAHRLAWLWVHGKWPENQIDHKDGNRRNNAISNLREATNGQNMTNRPASNRSKTGIRGVYIHKPSGRYRVQLGHHRRIHIGYFDDLESASAAALRAAKVLHGAFTYGG